MMPINHYGHKILKMRTVGCLIFCNQCIGWHICINAWINYTLIHFSAWSEQRVRDALPTIKAQIKYENYFIRFSRLQRTTIDFFNYILRSCFSALVFWLTEYQHPRCVPTVITLSTDWNHPETLHETTEVLSALPMYIHNKPTSPNSQSRLVFALLFFRMQH